MLLACGVAIGIMLTASNPSPHHGIATGKEDVYAEVVVSYRRCGFVVKVKVSGPLNGVIFLVMKEVFLVMKEVIVIRGPLRGQVINQEVSWGNMWAKFINYGMVKVRAQCNVHGQIKFFLCEVLIRGAVDHLASMLE